MNYEEFKSTHLGRAYDFDGAYGVQCVDGVNEYARCIGGKTLYCTASNYAKDIANQRATNGILTWCDDIGLNTVLKAGDICVWGECADTPYSHVAMYDHDDGENAVYFLGQNQGGYGFTISRIPVYGIIGVFRPKTLTHDVSRETNSYPSDFIHENGTMEVTVDAIKVRESPSLSGKDTGARYKKGDKIHYDGYVFSDGYIWVSYIAAQSKKRRWVAAGVAKNGVNVSPYGRFY